MSLKRSKGELRIRKVNDWWYAERWDGLYWVHVYLAPSLEELHRRLELMEPHPNIDTSASD